MTKFKVGLSLCGGGYYWIDSDHPEDDIMRYVPREWIPFVNVCFKEG